MIIYSIPDYNQIIMASMEYVDLMGSYLHYFKQALMNSQPVESYADFCHQKLLENNESKKIDNNNHKKKTIPSRVSKFHLVTMPKEKKSTKDKPIKTIKKDHKNYVKSCSQCQTIKTPEWRKGPDGSNTLCNACGLKYFRSRKNYSNNSNNKKCSECQRINTLRWRTGPNGILCNPCGLRFLKSQKKNEKKNESKNLKKCYGCNKIFYSEKMLNVFCNECCQRDNIKEEL